MSAGSRVGFLGLALAAVVAGGVESQPLPKVYLNHVVLVADSATYQAIGQSAFIRDTLGKLQQLTVSAGGGQSWSGTYFFGKNTYVELFAPGGVAGPEGIGMISFGVEESGGLNRLRDRMAQATKQPIDSMLRNRARGSEQVPWFYAISVHGVLGGSALPTWVMEYHPKHNKLWDPSIPPSQDGILRWQGLASVYDAARPLRDVIGVTVAVSPIDRSRIVAEAQALGYGVEEGGNRLQGPGVTIRLEDATGSRKGVIQIDLALDGNQLTSGIRPISPRSEIEVTGKTTAIWRFR